MSEFEKNEVLEEIVEETVETKVPAKKPRINWKNNRKLRFGTTATVLTVVVVAAVLVFNVIVSVLYDRFPLTWDLTADNAFTLSEESREVASKINTDVEILVFFDENTFSAPNTSSEELNTVLRQFYIFTKDYATLSGGKVKIKYLDPEANPTILSTYKQYEVSSGDILVRSDNQYRVFAATDLYAEEMDANYATTYSSLVEQKLATTLNTVCGGKSITLTFLTGHGESNDLITMMQETYERNGYLTDTLNLATAKDVDETTGAMIIAGPTTDFSVDEITRLREWLYNDGVRGRNLYVLCNFDGECPNLYDFLSSDYGITVTDNLLVETNEENYLMMMGDGMYAPITTVEGTDLTTDSEDKEVMMPYTLQLETTFGTDSEKESVVNFPLITFPESTKLIKYSELTEENQDIQQTDAAEYPVIGMAYATEQSTKDNLPRETTVVVSGSYLFPAYSSLSQYANEMLYFEPIRTLNSLGDTTVLSSMDLTVPTLSYSVAEARAIELCLLALPVILIVICLVVFLRRRHL